MLRPGTVFKEYNSEIAELWSPKQLETGLLDKHDVQKQNPKKPLYRKYFITELLII